jgi:hypothetical protein
VLDLKEVTLVGQAAVRFLARVEAEGIRIVNCPGYVRSWIAAERDSRSFGQSAEQGSEQELADVMLTTSSHRVGGDTPRTIVGRHPNRWRAVMVGVNVPIAEVPGHG